MEKRKQREHFRIFLRFNKNDIYDSKEYSVKEIRKVFSNEIITEKYKVQKYFIDLVFPVHKLGTEIDECVHIDRCETEEKKRQELIERETGFKIIIINPDKKNFDICDEIGQIQSFINE